MECDDGVEAVKNRCPNGMPAAFLQSAFPELYRYRTRKNRHRLLFWAFAAKSAPHFLTKRAAARERARADSGRNCRGFE